MTSKPWPDCKLIGWKVWYYNNSKENIYSSKTNSWNGLPAQGVQFMRRYYQDSKGRKWSENISGLDLYTERPDNLNNTVKLLPYIKVGSNKTHAELVDHLNLIRAELETKYKTIVDNSIEKYVDNKKTQIDWFAVRENHGSLKRYLSSEGVIWENIPQDNMIFLGRVMKNDNNIWIEQQFNQDLFVLNTEQEIQAIKDSSAIKRGLMIDSEILREISFRAGSDDERFA